MGYLTDNTNVDPYYGRIGDCPALYPYGLIVEWMVNDPFHYENDPDTIVLAVKEALPDTQDWQCSVLRAHRKSPYLKLRFKDEASRTVARNKLSIPTLDYSIRVTALTDQNPPDLANRGIA